MISRQVILLSILALVPESAAAYCSTPSAPYCATSYGAFDDQDDFEDCKRDLESYRGEVDDFLSCVAEDARTQSDEAISEYNSAVESFNRRAND